MPPLPDLSCTPGTVLLTTRFDGNAGSKSAAALDQLNPRLRRTHLDWTFGEIKRWNRGEVQVSSFRHDYFAGERALSHIESDVFTEVTSSLLHPGLSFRFLYIVRGDLRTSRGFQYEFGTSTMDANEVEAAGECREGSAYRKEPHHNIRIVFDLVEKLRTVRDWSLHWTALRYSLFDPEVNKWLI
jgi:hypothetical protein